jgi:hypothetical protein
MVERPWKHDHTFGQDEKKPGEMRTLIVVLLRFTERYSDRICLGSASSDYPPTTIVAVPTMVPRCRQWCPFGSGGGSRVFVSVERLNS